MDAATDSALKRVLIVDDEPGVLIVVERLLRLEGYRVGTARDGAEGLRRFAGETWDLVITDRSMPELNGEELAQAIKAQAPAMPVIMLTGFTHLIEHRELFAAVLKKPFTRQELAAAVRAALQGGGK